MFQSTMIMIYVVQEIFDILCAMWTLCFLCTVVCSRARVHPWRRVSRSRMDSSLWCTLLWISVPLQDNVPLCQWCKCQISARLTRVIYVYTLDCQTHLWPGGHRLRWGECDTQGVYKINFSEYFSHTRHVIVTGSKKLCCSPCMASQLSNLTAPVWSQAGEQDQCSRYNRRIFCQDILVTGVWGFEQTNNNTWFVKSLVPPSHHAILRDCLSQQDGCWQLGIHGFAVVWGCHRLSGLLVLATI